MAIFEPIFKALDGAGVRYVVVGGLAVVLHGHARLTADVDLIVDLDEAQAARTIDALVACGLRPRVPVDARDFSVRVIRESWVRDRGMQVFSMADPLNPLRSVDLFVEHLIPFEDLWSRSDQVGLRGTVVRIASIPDLITLKRSAGRPQDLADIERLEAILHSRQNQGNA